jgi:Rrf2 family protein
MAQLVRISEAASLALHTMALLAREDHRRLATQEIAERLGASSHHLAKVMQRLIKAGLVESVRGPRGGFQLRKPAAEIKVLDIYEAIEGCLMEDGCLLGKEVCDAKRECVLGDLVRKVNEVLRERLQATTLAELALQAAFLRN